MMKYRTPESIDLKTERKRKRCQEISGIEWTTRLCYGVEMIECPINKMTQAHFEYSSEVCQIH